MGDIFGIKSWRMQKTPDHLWPVPVQLLSLVALELQKQGSTVTELLSGTEIGEEHLFDSEMTVSYRTAMKILSRALELSTIPHLAFAVGAQQSTASLGVLGYGINCCTDLREAVEVARDYHRISSTLLLGEQDEDNNYFRWTAAPPIELGSLLRFLVEEEFCTIIHTVEILVGEPFQIEEVHFQHQKPDYFELYDQFFRCPIIFSSDRNQLVLPSHVLDKPILNANPLSAKTAKRLCEDFLKANPAASDLIAQVQQFALQAPHMLLDEETVASRLNITSRTLRNRLKKQGTSYREIVHILREQIAKKQLGHERLSVSKIAEQVGYSDARAFRRAFKQWTGMTPEMFRNQEGDS